MPNKYYLRSDRMAVNLTDKIGDIWCGGCGTCKTCIHEIATLPGLPVEPSFLKTLSVGWFEGVERYERCGLHMDNWYQVDKYGYDKAPEDMRRLTIIAPQEAEKGQEGLKSKSKRITLCGSTKFKAEFEAINRQLTLEGNVVYSVCAFGHKDNIKWTDQQKKLLDEVHKRKIDNSDGIFVINVDDYIGESTRSEIEYAEHTGKFVKYLSDFPDLKYISDAAMIAAASRPTDTVDGLADPHLKLIGLLENGIQAWEQYGDEVKPEGLVDIMIEAREILNNSKSPNPNN